MKTTKKLFKEEIKLIPILKLKINPYQSTYFTDSSDNEKSRQLKESIKKYGIKTPIKITQDYVIIGGHRRHRVALELNFDTVPCMVAAHPLKRHELKLHCLEDNYLQRQLGGRQRKLVYQDMIEILKKEIPDFEHLVRQGRSGLIDKIQKTGLSLSTSEKVAAQSRRIAKRKDNAEIKDVIPEDKNKIFGNLKQVVFIFKTSNYNTMAEMWPEIEKIYKDLKRFYENHPK